MTASTLAPLRVALIGYGALGQAVAAELAAGHLPGAVFLGALTRSNSSPPDQGHGWQRLEQLLASRPDLVVEVAGHGALAGHAPACLQAGHDVLAASVGALLDAALHERLLAAARAGCSRLIVPAGALGGIDYLHAARRLGPVQVRYRGRKPVAAWRGTAADTLVDLDGLREATTFFRANAQEAARRFPQNANVVAALALAVGDADAVSVELVADPGITANIHEVEASGAAGSLRLSVQNEAMPGNPKSSRITAYSILHAIASHPGVRRA